MNLSMTGFIGVECCGNYRPAGPRAWSFDFQQAHGLVPVPAERGRARTRNQDLLPGPAATSTGSCGCTNFGLACSVGAETGVVPLVDGGASVGAEPAPASTGAGASISQSQPSLMQLRKLPCLVRFSTMNGAWHFGHGSLIGSRGLGETPSGGRTHPREKRTTPPARDSPFLDFGALEPEGDRAGVLAFRIVGTTDEIAEASSAAQ